MYGTIKQQNSTQAMGIGLIVKKQVEDPVLQPSG